MIKTWNEYNLYFVIRPDYDICPQILAIADTVEEAIAYAEKLEADDRKKGSLLPGYEPYKSPYFCVVDECGTFYRKGEC